MKTPTGSKRIDLKSHEYNVGRFGSLSDTYFPNYNESKYNLNSHLQVLTEIVSSFTLGKRVYLHVPD